MKDAKNILFMILTCISAPLLGAEARLQPAKSPQVSALQQLPLELQTRIISILTTSGSWQEPAQAIRALSQTDKHFYTLINDEKITNSLITLLADRWFDGYRLLAAWQLRTPGAKDWFNTEEAKKWFREYYPLHANAVNRDLIYFAQSAHSFNRTRAVLLLNLGVNLKGVENAEQVLRIMLKRNDLELFKKLLEAGVDPNTRSYQDGQTILEQAVWAQNLQAIDILLEAGADPDPTDSKGTLLITQLKKRVKHCLPENIATYEAIIKTLEAARKRNSKEEKPLEYARNKGNT